jgi:predicted AAA+ superfamily ATPase
MVRNLFQPLLRHLLKKEFTIMTGARQTGKSTLLKQLNEIERTVSIADTDKFCRAICAFANDFPHSRKLCYLFIEVKDNGELSGSTFSLMS